MAKAKAADSVKVIEIPEIQLTKMVVTIKGETPLIVHKFGDKARAQIEDKQQKKAKTVKEARDPELEFRDSLYVMRNGRYGFPAGGIKKALVNAGGRFADEKMTVLRGVINVIGDLLEIKGSEPQMRSDTCRLNGGTTSITYRPMFDPWEIDIPVVFNSAMMSDSQLLNLFNVAGFSVGLGDWRVEKNGIFGQFSIKEVKNI